MANPILRQTGLPDVVFSRGYTYPGRRPVQPVQVREFRSDGRMQTATLADPDERFVLEFQQLQLADRTAVDAFLRASAVNFSAQPFTFIDLDGTEHNVRYIDSVFDMVNSAAQLYRLTLTLRIEPVV